MLLRLPFSSRQSPPSFLSFTSNSTPIQQHIQNDNHQQHQQQHQQQEQEQEDTIFHLINSSPSPNSLATSLKSLPSPLPPSLVDRLLKRVRFSHSNPLKALSFFTLTSQNPSFPHTPFSHDTMLYILARARLFPHMWSLLRQSKAKNRSFITARTLHIVLGRVAKVCSVRQTVDSFRKFKSLSPRLDTDCFNALLRTLCQEKSMRDARNVYHALKHEFPPDLRTFNILLSGWKSVEEAEGFFGEMVEMGVRPDLVSYNCLIDVYCKNREVGKACKVFDELPEKGFSPDVFSYTSVIGGLGLVGQPDKAKEVLKDMREMGCQPDVAAYNAAIRNYCIAKRLGNAFALMEEMERRGLRPNPTSYNLFFRCFYWANELENSWRLYRRMRGDGCLPNTQSCMFLVRMCRRQEKVGMALELWDDMVKNGFGSLVLVSDVLFDLLCDLGKLDEAERCFVEMVDVGQKPSGTSFRRIRVLMELAKRGDCMRNLEEKMGGFGVVMMEADDERVEKSLEMPHAEFVNL